MSIALFFMCCLFFSNFGADCKECKNVALNTKINIDTVRKVSCQSYLEGIGMLSLYNNEAIDPMPCQYLKEAYASGNHKIYNNSNGKYTCACWPGYHDNLSVGGNSGLIHLSSEFDIKNIQCNTTCGMAYQNILKIVDRSACECYNSQGCLFRERSMLKNIAEKTTISAVLVVPTNLLLDSSIVYCKQFSEKYVVTMSEILTCQLSSIEYLFYTRCETSCMGKPNMRCQTNFNNVQQCDLSCVNGYFLEISHDMFARCVPIVLCKKHFYTDGKNACLACPIGKHREILPFEKLHNYQSESFCVDCAPGKIQKSQGHDCIDLVSETANESKVPINCNHDGFGWNQSSGYCRICPLNSFSKATTNTSDVILCQVCPIDRYTTDVGSTACLQCPEFSSRFENTASVGCNMCPQGKFFETSLTSCETCPANTVKSTDGLKCSECSVLHVSNHNHTICEECEAGKIRQSASSFLSCEFCPDGYYILNRECVPCFEENTVCDTGYYLDTCTNTSTLGVGCVCGCSPCYWQQEYEGFLENFVVLPGCIPSCADGYKLDITNRNSPICIEQILLLPQTAALSYQKFISTNSTDLTLYSCNSFLTLSLLDIFIHFHMELCSADIVGRVEFRQNILINFIRENREIPDMHKNCFFCCKNGYTPEKSLGLDYFECVPTDSSCLLHSKHYERQFCYEYMD